MPKSLLFLGGHHFQLSAIRHAKNLGYKVYVASNNSNVPGARAADQFFLVDTTDINAIKEIRDTYKIDAVSAFASDPAAITVAHIHGNKYPVSNMASKDKFRGVLRAGGFNTPDHWSTHDASNAIDMAELLLKNSQIVIKPVDSSGSKGVTVVTDKSQIEDAIKAAFQYSRSGFIIIERFVKRKGYQIAGDGLVHNGKLIFRFFANEHFRPDGVVPTGESWPCTLSDEIQQKIHDEAQRFVTHVGYIDGAINFDVMIDEDNNIYLMELGPRAGGNAIPDMINMVTGEDYIRAVIEQPLGITPQIEMRPAKGFHGNYIIHSDKEGIFSHLHFSEEIKDNLMWVDLFISENNPVKPFNGSNATLGVAYLIFKNQAEMLHKMDTMHNYVTVIMK